MSLDRRALVKAAAAAPMAIAGAIGLSMYKVPRPTEDAIRGQLHILAPRPPRHPELRETSEASLLVSIDLATGTTRETHLPMAAGHYAHPLEDQRLLCVSHHGRLSLVVENGRHVVAAIRAPAGYLFGGHACVTPDDRDTVLIPVRHEAPKSLADTGRLLIVDRSTFTVRDIVDSGGLHPHEICSIPGTREVCLTHYGDIAVRRRPFRHNVVGAKLSILDSRTLAIKREYPQTGIDAMLTHMRVDEERRAWCVATQFVDIDVSRLGPDAALSAAASEYEAETGAAIDFPIRIEDGGFSLPLPILAIDTQTGAAETYLQNKSHQLRSQSVEYNHLTNSIVATYVHSNSLMIHDARRGLRRVSGSDLHLSSVRGVAEIPTTSLIAVSASGHDVVLYDLASERVVTKYETRNFAAPHVSFQSA